MENWLKTFLSSEAQRFAANTGRLPAEPPPEALGPDRAPPPVHLMRNETIGPRSPVVRVPFDQVLDPNPEPIGPAAFDGMLDQPARQLIENRITGENSIAGPEIAQRLAADPITMSHMRNAAAGFGVERGIEPADGLAAKPPSQMAAPQPVPPTQRFAPLPTVPNPMPGWHSFRDQDLPAIPQVPRSNPLPEFTNFTPNTEFQRRSTPSRTYVPPSPDRMVDERWSNGTPMPAGQTQSNLIQGLIAQYGRR